MERRERVGNRRGGDCQGAWRLLALGAALASVWLWQSHSEHPLWCSRQLRQFASVGRTPHPMQISRRSKDSKRPQLRRTRAASTGMLAASSIHGTGAQKLARSMHDSRIEVSGIAFGPHYARRGSAFIARETGRQQSSPTPCTSSRVLQRECALTSGSATQYPGRRNVDAGRFIVPR